MSAIKELQNYTFISKYARWIPEKKRRETWKEAVDRVRNMMLEKYAEYGIDDDINWAYDMMQKKKVLGSQRALQYAGLPILKKHARIFNCVGSYCDRLRFFQEAFWLLLCGCGITGSVQKHHIEKLPNFVQPSSNNILTYNIDDSVEDWANSLGVLLTNYFGEFDSSFKEYVPSNCKRIEFDYNQIRPKGSPLSSGSGKAPGPAGLKKALENIELLLQKCRDTQKKLKSIDIVDIICYFSDAVLSGGCRRSACSTIFSINDEDMLQAKTGNWLHSNPQRARTNNSVVLLRNQTSFEEFKNIVFYIKEYGEPGFYWTNSTETVPNPCYEVGLYPVDTKTQKSGWQGCNLSTINCGSLKDEKDFYDRCRAAALIGTIQAKFTNVSYLGEVSKNIFKQEALIGVSMTGVMEKFEIVLKPEVQKRGSEIVKKINKKFAKKININQAARNTCLKPEGTSSCLLGTTSGLHPHTAKRYIRRLQNNNIEVPYKFFKQHNPQACEISVWNTNQTDENILFPIEVPDGSKTKNQIPALDMLKIIQSTQKHWINNGKNIEICSKPWLNHNVSNTITIMPNEWEEVTKYIFDNKQDFAGISLLPLSGDKDYPQAPFTAVYTSREIVKEYGEAAIWCSGLIELALTSFDNLWDACTATLNDDFVKEKIQEIHSGLEKGIPLHSEQSKFWEKARKFSDKYFNKDVRKLTYCLKDVYNWKLYCDLKDSFVPVDYTKMIEEEDNTKPEQEIACGGGACLL